MTDLYKIQVKTSAKKELKKIPKAELRKILQKIESLAEDPRPPSSTKLTNQEKYRIRQGNYRIVYSINDDELIVWIVKAGHRKEVYKLL